MIQPLRNIHRRVFLAFAFILPAIFVSGIRARRAWPVMAVAPPDNAVSTGGVETDGNWKTLHIRIRTFPAGPGAEALRVQLAPQNDLAEPEVLVYWSSVEPKGSSLPNGARLRGKLDPAILYALPEEAHDGGFLILFSASRNSLLDWTLIGGNT